MILKSVNLRLEKKAFSASCLKKEQMVMNSLNRKKKGYSFGTADGVEDANF